MQQSSGAEAELTPMLYPGVDWFGQYLEWKCAAAPAYRRARPRSGFDLSCEDGRNPIPLTTCELRHGPCSRHSHFFARS